ncbi:MAG: protein kinase [Vicinamibacterales bacterium]
MSTTPGNSPTTIAAVRTLVVTDLVGSTALLAAVGDRRGAEIFSRTDRVARDLLVTFHGREIDRTDGFLLLFDRPADAARYAMAFHEALARVSTELGLPLGARAGIHLGEVYLRENSAEDIARGAKSLEVEGLAKATVARLASLAGAGQTLLTEPVFDAVRSEAADSGLADTALAWLAHGPYAFKGVEEPIEVFEIGRDGVAPLAVPADTEKARRAVRAGDEVTLGWRPAPGQEIPRRPGWRVDAKLGEGGFGEAWLATNQRTGERHVFKFCFVANRLRGLRREVTIFRLLKDALGDRDDIARLLDWQFDEPPFFLEAEYTPGGNLEEWAAAQGGLREVPLATRLELVAQTAVAVAAAHAVGVLHKDIKPANVLVATADDGTPKARLTDFGIGMVESRQALMARGITAQGFTQVSAEITTGTGTLMYMAPEIIEGRAPTIQADLYALGVMLYQVVVGDFGRAMASSWSRDVGDELLREEIAALVDGVPERRPASATQVAQHLRTLDERRAGRDRLRREREHAEATRLALAASQRRRRLVSVVAGVAVVVLAIVSVLAYQAARAREEADLRRGQAEDLFGYLLGDLRSKLRPVGRLDLLDDVGARAIGYFDALPADLRTDGDLIRHAKTLAQIGQVRMDQGRLPDALDLFTQSLTLAEAVVARNPGNGEWLFELAQSQYWIGAVLRRQADPEGALAYWQQYLESALALNRLDPDRREWQLEVGYAYGNLGLLQEGGGRFSEAVASYRGSLAIKEAVARAEPDAVQPTVDVAVSHNKIAVVLDRMGALDEALQEYDAAQAIRASLVARDPRNADWKFRLAVSLDNRGILLLALGRVDEARRQFDQQRALFAELTTLDPSNATWQRGLAVAESDLALIALEQGDAGAAEARAREAIRVLAPVSAANPTNLDWRIDLAYFHRLAGEARLARGDAAGAAAEARVALAELDALEGRDVGDEGGRRQRAASLVLLGRTLAGGGRVREAAGAWQDAVALGSSARDADRWRMLEIRASALVYAGRLDEAAPIVDRLQALGFARPSFLRLCREAGLGTNP